MVSWLDMMRVQAQRATRRVLNRRGVPWPPLPMDWLFGCSMAAATHAVICLHRSYCRLQRFPPQRAAPACSWRSSTSSQRQPSGSGRQSSCMAWAANAVGTSIAFQGADVEPAIRSLARLSCPLGARPAANHYSQAFACTPPLHNWARWPACLLQDGCAITTK